MLRAVGSPIVSLHDDVRALLRGGRSLLRAIETALLAPRRFFAESPHRDSLGAAVAIVVFVAAAVTLGIVLLGGILEATVDATVTIDNPDRPDDWVCDQLGNDTDAPMYDACQEPARIDRDLGTMLREATGEFLHYGFLGVGIWWLVAGGIVHVGARLAGGRGSIGESLSVAAWALLPELFRLAVGLVGIYYALSETTVRATSPEGFREELLSAFAAIEGPLLAASLLTIAWQWWILRGGIAERHDLSTAAAGGVAGIFAVIAVLIAA